MSIEAMKQALDALEKNYKLINGDETRFGLEGALDGYYSGCFGVAGTNKETESAITSLRQAIKEWSLKMNDRQRLEAIVSVVCKYLPPDGISKDQALNEIIGLVDPLPPQRPKVVFPTMLRKMWSGGEVQAWLDENVNKEKNNG